MHKLVQNGSSNGWPDAAIEGALDGDLLLDLNGRLRVLCESN